MKKVLLYLVTALCGLLGFLGVMRVMEVLAFGGAGGSTAYNAGRVAGQVLLAILCLAIAWKALQAARST